MHTIVINKAKPFLHLYIIIHLWKSLLYYKDSQPSTLNKDNLLVRGSEHVISVVALVWSFCNLILLFPDAESYTISPWSKCGWTIAVYSKYLL